MNKILWSLLIIGFPSLLLGQEIKTDKLNFSVGYFGETLTHPGVSVGIEYYPNPPAKFQSILAANLGGYVHVRNNTSLFIRGQWGQRVTFSNGIFIEEFLGLGYLHHFTHGGLQYEILPNGAVTTVSNWGKPMIMPVVSAGTGIDFSQKTDCKIKIFLRPELFWKAPFNGYYLTHFALNVGVIF